MSLTAPFNVERNIILLPPKLQKIILINNQKGGKLSTVINKLLTMLYTPQL